MSRRSTSGGCTSGSLLRAPSDRSPAGNGAALGSRCTGDPDAHAAAAGHRGAVWDGLEFFGPYQMLIGDYVHSGRLLLWNPSSHLVAGCHRAALGAFSPLVSLFGLLFGGEPLRLRALLVVGVAAWSTRPAAAGTAPGEPAWGAYAVSVAWAMSGFYTGHAEHTALDHITMSSLPWMSVAARRLSYR